MLIQKISIYFLKSFMNHASNKNQMLPFVSKAVAEIKLIHCCLFLLQSFFSF